MATNSPRAVLQPGFERARLVTGAVVAVEILDVDALRRVAPHRQLRDFPGLVGGVVQHLDFEQLARVVEAADRPRSAGRPRTSRCRSAAGP